MAQEGLFGASGGSSEVPSRFIRVELIGGPAETKPVVGGELSVLGLECSIGRWRAGITAYTLLDLGVDPDMRRSEVAQLHVGYTVWRNPVRAACAYMVLPDILVGVEGGVIGSPNCRIFAGARVDGPGLGVGVEAGVMALRDWGRGHMTVGPYVAARLSLPVLNFGF